MKPSDLETKKKLLTEKMKKYCVRLPGCEVPSPDKEPVRVIMVINLGEKERKKYI